MNILSNPILRGFNPDPSIIRVEGDYYLATSTFEWFPGIQIHHSKDLRHWELIRRPLDRISQLDMRGNPDSCGAWAPCLTYDNGTYYLVYTNVRSFDGVWKDTPNFLVTAPTIMGPWSEPIFLSSSGFDGSIFHDDDGRKWYTSMITDHRKGKFFGGIILQEYDQKQQKLVGQVHHIFKGTDLDRTEAPHIYKRNGYYYLMTAEGGTEYGHAITLCRSKSLTGPYEVHPQNPLISARSYPEAPLQKCGHGDLVESMDGSWYCVFLVGRPLSKLGRCILGRETAIEEVEWREDDWLYMKDGIKFPRLQFAHKAEEEQKVDKHVSSSHIKYKFDEPELSIDFQSLRIPITKDWLSLSKKPGYLRLFGRESLSSLHEQSLIARRIQHFHSETTTCLAFNPQNFQQMAGLICYYNTAHWYYLNIMGDEDEESSFLQIISCDNFEMQDQLEQPIHIRAFHKIYLKAKINFADLQFYYSDTGKNWQKVGPVLDASILSDDYVRDGSDKYRPAFTGAFAGICCQDLTGQRKYADFGFFEYKGWD